MKFTHLATAAAALTLLGGAAYAQQPTEPAPTPDQKPAEATPAPPPADATTPAPPASTTTPAPPADTSASAVTPPPADTSATAASSTASNAASFANLTTTNGPVPDTAENRKKYGKPMSNAGKRSAAKGN